MWPSVRPQASTVETGRVLERDAGHYSGTYMAEVRDLRRRRSPQRGYPERWIMSVPGTPRV
jgi:hypothetical protein